MGAHAISGAVMDPRELRELMPDYREQGFPAESDVTDEEVLHLSEKGAFLETHRPTPKLSMSSASPRDQMWY